MYNLKVDCHTHTIHTHHAYSTIAENVQIAAEKELEAIAITDHFGLQLPWLMEHRQYSLENHTNTKIPKIMRGVRVFRGVEVDIIGFDGTLAGSEMPLSFFRYPDAKNFIDFIMATKDVVIASMHYFEGNRSKTIIENTQMYVNVLSHKNVDILGHPTRSGLDFDWSEVVSAAKTHGKMIEINNETLRSRPKQTRVNKELALLCANAGVSICVGSDAHICFDVGEFTLTEQMLAEIGFPAELIATRSLSAFEAALQKSRGEI